jgi:crotonobetainyl-CoA:carnitine CoA-transferase CaiB-like acyl-CoA transferase
VYACRGHEQWVALSVAGDDAWRALGDALGNPGWASDRRFATGAGRRAHHDDIDAGLGRWFSDRNRDEAVAILVEAGVHAATVWDQNLQDELPQLAQREFTQWLDHPVAGRVPHPGIGLRSPQFDLRYRAPAPTVGQHTGEVLQGMLGIGDDELGSLAADGVIGRIER